MIRLILPEPKYREKIWDYRDEFIRNGDSMDGTAGLRKALSFEEWYAAVRDNQREETVRGGLVPATSFLAVDESDETVGMIDVRHRLSRYLFEYGGHIGYSVRKSQRRRGFATEMLRLALNYCREIGISKCLVTCNKNNIASAKTIAKNGGVLENEVSEGEITVQRYWISL